VLDKAEYSAFQSTLNSAIVSYRIEMSMVCLARFDKLLSKTKTFIIDIAYKHINNKPVAINQATVNQTS